MSPPSIREMATALAEDAEALAALHDRELSAEMLAALRDIGFPSNLGLLPAGGGLKELALRASNAAGPGGDVFAELKKVFETIAMGKVSASAVEAKELGLVRKDDVVAFNAYELLHIAKQEALALAERGYRPPLPGRRIQVAGDVGIATFKMMLVNMLEGRFVSPPD